MTSALLWWAVLACKIDPFETPSAYDQQKYLCDEPDQLDAAALACDADPMCTGLLSFEGELQGVPIAVGSSLAHSLVRVAQGTSGQRHLGTVSVAGSAPYFHFDVQILSVGGEWNGDGADLDWSVDFGSGTAKSEADYLDDEGAIEWTLDAGSDSLVLQSVPGEGTIQVTYVSSSRVDLSFEGTVGEADDVLNACLVVFPERVEIVPVP